MKVLLIDVDSKIPNLALMKISAYHKLHGDKVFLAYGCKPDKVYISCVYDWNKPQALGIGKMFSCSIEYGGYGINKKHLAKEIEHLKPDYSLYPNMDYSMGFTSRGCIRKCPFCLVWRNEGKIQNNAPIEEFWESTHKKVLLLDNNYLASPKWKENIHFLLEHQLEVSWCQGLDIRLVNDDNAFWLAQVESRTMAFKGKRYYFAFDDPTIEQQLLDGMEVLESHGIKAHQLSFFILCGFNTTHAQDMHRVNVIKKLGSTPFVMKYNRRQDDLWLNHFARWVNKHVYRSCTFEDYDRGNSQQIIAQH